MSGHVKLRQILDQAPEPDPYTQAGVLCPHQRVTEQHSTCRGCIESGPGRHPRSCWEALTGEGADQEGGPSPHRISVALDGADALPLSPHPDGGVIGSGHYLASWQVHHALHSALMPFQGVSASVVLPHSQRAASEPSSFRHL